MIKKTKSGYKAATSSGRPLSNKTQTKKEAARQIAAVEASKARRKKK